MPKKSKMNINSKKQPMGIKSTRMPNTKTGKATKQIRSTRTRTRGGNR